MSEKKYTPNQLAIANAIGSHWPQTAIREHDAGCYEAMVDSNLQTVQSLMGRFKGICYGPSVLGGVEGRCYIQF